MQGGLYVNLPNTAAQRACSLAAARANPLFYAVVAKDVVFGSAGTPRLANPVWCPCEEYTLDPGVYLRTIFHRCLRRRVESRVTNQEKSSVKSPVIVQSVLVRCKNHSETALSQSSFLKIKISEFPPLPLQSKEEGGGERFCRNTPL